MLETLFNKVAYLKALAIIVRSQGFSPVTILCMILLLVRYEQMRFHQKIYV